VSEGATPSLNDALGQRNGAEQMRVRRVVTPPMLDVHSLRHSYVTHLVEAGFPERFVTEQVGHSWGSTTAIYCSLSDDYKNRVLAKAIAGAFRASPNGDVP
jgi:site-specific recombinase XerC